VTPKNRICPVEKAGHLDGIIRRRIQNPNPDPMFAEIKSILKPGGLLLIVEPPLHVSKNAFEETVRKAVDAGLSEVARPKFLLSKAVLLKKI
jgi:hypothetical protein